MGADKGLAVLVCPYEIVCLVTFAKFNKYLLMLL
jgi:hypothetical protein